MYGIPERYKSVSPAEEKILLALWACRTPASRRDIERQLAALPRTQWTAGTVLKLLDRLAAKGWVRVEKDANRNVYTPTVTRRAYGVWVMRERLDTLFGGDVAEAVRALVSESGCSAAELERAIAVLNEQHARAADFDDDGGVWDAENYDQSDQYKVYG